MATLSIRTYKNGDRLTGYEEAFVIVEFKCPDCESPLSEGL